MDSNDVRKKIETAYSKIAYKLGRTFPSVLSFPLKHTT